MILEIIFLFQLTSLIITVGFWIHYCTITESYYKKIKKYNKNEAKEKIKSYIHANIIRYRIDKHGHEIEHVLDYMEKEKIADMISNTIDNYKKYDNWKKIAKNELKRRNYHIDSTFP